MNVFSCYSTQIKEHDIAFQQTIDIYRLAVSFFINVVMQEWNVLVQIPVQQHRQVEVERMTIITKSHPVVKYDFSSADKRFFKMPAYLRRAAIMEALGKVFSYKSNLENWESSDVATRGKRPSYPKVGYDYPVLYRKNMYLETDNLYAVQIKVFIRNTWDWMTVSLRKSDVDYMNHHCKAFTGGDGAMLSRKVCAPTLRRRYKKWYLDFPVEEKVTLGNTSIEEQRILAVDLGINNSCTCSIMEANGAVIGREFLSLPRENDSLQHALNRIKKVEQNRNYKTPRLWSYAKGINDDIAVKTASFIIDTAVRYDVDGIVMEHLEVRGKKRGSKKQRLHMWKSQYVQSMVIQKAHRNGIRVSHVCACGTSRLAYDGTGKVLRGKESEHTNGNYSLCEFSTGKIYHCDLNASYNIGARYFIRELLKSLTERKRLRLEAKVPSICTRSTCTLSTLISLYAEMSTDESVAC